MSTKKSNTIKSPAKSLLNKKLLPTVLVEKYKKTFVQNGFTPNEVDDLIKTISIKIGEVEQRVAELKKYAGLPVVKLVKCSCTHNNCSTYSINGVSLCYNYANILRAIPGIEKDGANVGMIWSALKRAYMVNDSIRAVLKDIMTKFSTADRAKIYQKIPEVKKFMSTMKK